MHNQEQKNSYCIHSVLYFLSVELDSPAETALCVALYTYDDFQRT